MSLPPFISALLLVVAASTSLGPDASAKPKPQRGLGHLETVTFTSRALPGKRSYEVWLPPERVSTKKADKPAPLPVVVLLHGLGGAGRDWFDPALGGLAASLDQLVGTGRLAPFIAIAPNGGNGYWTDHLDRPHLRYGAFIDEAVADAERRFHGSGTRALVGVSMGGHGAMSRGLMAPERWSAIVSIAGALFAEPPTHRKIYKEVWGFPADAAHWKATAPMALMAAVDKGHLPPIFLHCGKSDLDRFLDMTMAADERLRSLGVEPELVLTDGGHNWTTWSGINERWLVWLDRALLKTRP